MLVVADEPYQSGPSEHSVNPSVFMLQMMMRNL